MRLGALAAPQTPQRPRVTIGRGLFPMAKPQIQAKSVRVLLVWCGRGRIHFIVSYSIFKVDNERVGKYQGLSHITEFQQRLIRVAWTAS